MPAPQDEPTNDPLEMLMNLKHHNAVTNANQSSYVVQALKEVENLQRQYDRLLLERIQKQDRLILQLIARIEQLEAKLN